MSGWSVALQYLLPHHLLCRAIYALTRARRRWLKDALIGAFMRAYRPPMADALEPEPRRYESFNAFFTRALRAGARPIDPDPRRVLSPCDGTLSIAGELQVEQLLQAKHRHYSLPQLLGGQSDWALALRGGSYATLYLAPGNYHRVHMPLDGRLRAAWHVPGRLFSVSPASVARVPGLFARNERIVLAFDGEHGPFAVVLVGALFVGSMSTVWHGEVTPWRRARHAGGSGSDGGIHRLEPTTGAELWQPRGAELGRFNMGSTVLLLLGPGLAAGTRPCSRAWQWRSAGGSAHCGPRVGRDAHPARGARALASRRGAGARCGCAPSCSPPRAASSPIVGCSRWTPPSWCAMPSPTCTSIAPRWRCRAMPRRCTCRARPSTR